jgi:hypothetical protein
VHDAFLVRGLQRVHYLPNQSHGLVERHGRTLEAPREVGALHELHRDRAQAA